MAITDLDELVLSCRTEQAKTYIQEAVGSYRAGAYRACIVATWIAVIFDLVEKVSDLALGGDAAARAMIEKYGGGRRANRGWKPGRYKAQS